MRSYAGPLVPRCQTVLAAARRVSKSLKLSRTLSSRLEQSQTVPNSLKGTGRPPLYDENKERIYVFSEVVENWFPEYKNQHAKLFLHSRFDPASGI